ncbi:ABC transporter ATP-binding protein [Piscirickettsia litoralis]|uniref:ABC transporter ATP-binding protein n=1 Tax=Piscirickettsia litoralis TaxID=1891921 RepID=A0ABX3A1J0_9GAMM|nr:ABC transporter ATP-binding protein [Piscirickettsia litoralis]ODN42504.1 ABC transporter ATP-binding protein [Piscirickettsia litoralis]
MADECLVEVNDVHYQVGHRQIFRGASLKFPKGKVIAVMGPSGTGKTTLLRLIGGQIQPNQGSVKLFGRDIATLKRKELYALRRDIGMLFQQGGLFTDISVYENVVFPLREHTDLAEEVLYEIALMKLEAVGLRGARDLMPTELSGGMARRVALARAIAFDPQLVLYDEPFTGLDPVAKGVIVKLIRELNDALGLTSILVSHDVDDVLAIADEIYIIANGQVIGYGSPDVLQRSDSPLVQQFLQGVADGPVAFHYPAVPYEQDLIGG